MTLGRVGHAHVWIGEILSRERVHCVSGFPGPDLQGPLMRSVSPSICGSHMPLPVQLHGCARCLGPWLVPRNMNRLSFAPHDILKFRNEQGRLWSLIATFSSSIVWLSPPALSFKLPPACSKAHTSMRETATREREHRMLPRLHALGGGEKTWKRSHINNRMEKKSQLPGATQTNNMTYPPTHTHTPDPCEVNP